MAVPVDELRRDLAAETASLLAILRPLREAAWRTPTPAEGWTIADQIGHLAYFDEAATLAMHEPERFSAEASLMLTTGTNFPDQLVLDYRSLTGRQVVAWFEQVRAELIERSANLDATTRVPWYGPPMSLASMLTARVMETWAHGQDVADALGIHLEPTVRLRHVAHLGVGARPYSYRVRGLTAPTGPVRVELHGPDGSLWTWGPADAADRVSGEAYEFCRVVTQRQNLADTSLKAVGDDAISWLEIAQAFAGAPGSGRPARAEQPA
jgi:uncharacterized protein (TIGR03084 family)